MRAAWKTVIGNSTAPAVLEGTKGLYSYYHSLLDANPDASFYDIRLRFQKTDELGRINPLSADETYNALRTAQKDLTERITEGVYWHGF